MTSSDHHCATARRRVAAIVAFALATIGLVVVGGSVEAQVVVRIRAGEVTRVLHGLGVIPLPFAARDIAVHWQGNPDAQVTYALSGDGVSFGASADVGRDEVGEQRGNGETYGAVIPAAGATFVRVSSDRPLGRLTVLALADGERVVTYKPVPGRPAGGAVTQRPIVPRSG
ncbi:MAG: hypothetical protein ABR540_18575 [Acidimicrobiales bacterium]